MNDISKTMPEVTVDVATEISLDEQFNVLMVDHSHLDYMRDTLKLFYLRGARAALAFARTEMFPEEIK